jgi:hypothetical protein
MPRDRGIVIQVKTFIIRSDLAALKIFLAGRGRSCE